LNKKRKKKKTEKLIEAHSLIYFFFFLAIFPLTRIPFYRNPNINLHFSYKKFYPFLPDLEENFIFILKR